MQREMRQKFKEDGILVLTTPLLPHKIYLIPLANLFGPLPVKHDEVYSCGGKIRIRQCMGYVKKWHRIDMAAT